jgi:chorismate mutase
MRFDINTRSKIKNKMVEAIEIEKNWLTHTDQPYIIAGPCSAETEEQVWQTLLGLHHLPIDAVRAGIWKPRTRPGGFEGVGAIGLPWLVQACAHIGKPAMIEVATPQHVETALKAGIDMLWIGARTTVNPFSVQAIADALQGVKVPVFVKNPVNPDLNLWIGAIERVNRAGITQLAAIHRGFSSASKTIYRNEPNWEIAIELKTRFPNLPLICDPSHICGRTDLLLETAQHAYNLNYQGIIIETHATPHIAWSDAQQQITPNELSTLLAALHNRKTTENDQKTDPILQNFRTEIDTIDKQLVDLLAQRFDVVKELGNYKKHHSIAILQPDRWSKLFQDRQIQSQELQLEKGFIDRLFKIIHHQSISLQTQVFDAK